MQGEGDQPHERLSSEGNSTTAGVREPQAIACARRQPTGRIRSDGNLHAWPVEHGERTSTRSLLKPANGEKPTFCHRKPGASRRDYVPAGFHHYGFNSRLIRRSGFRQCPESRPVPALAGALCRNPRKESNGADHLAGAWRQRHASSTHALAMTPHEIQRSGGPLQHAPLPSGRNNRAPTLQQNEQGHRWEKRRGDMGSRKRLGRTRVSITNDVQALGGDQLRRRDAQLEL